MADTKPLVEQDPESRHEEPARRDVDINLYQHKKTLANAMLTLALLSVNVNQFHYIKETGHQHPYFITNITLISLSIMLLVVVAILDFLNSRYDITNGKDEDCRDKQKDEHTANKLNNFKIIGILGITIINIFIFIFCTPDTKGLEPS